MKKSILSILVVLLLTSSIPLLANDYYEKGNSFFSIRAGLSVPAVASFPNDKTEKPYVGSKNINMKLGGFGSLSFQMFINSKLALGGELGYNFNYVYKDIFTLVPITAKLTYLPVQTGKFDLALHANLGIEFVRFSPVGRRKLVPFTSVSVNPTYFFTDNWGIGLDAGCGFLYSNVKDKTKSAIFGYAPITLNATYRR